MCAQLCLTFCDPMDCSPPDSSVHGILQARILEWIAISSSWGSSQPRDRTWSLASPALTGRFFTTEPPGKPRILYHLPFDCDFVNFSLYFLKKKKKITLVLLNQTWVPSPIQSNANLLTCVMKENAAFIVGVKQGMQARMLCSGFRGSF